MKRFLLLIYTLLIVAMVVATFLEHSHDAAYAALKVYHAPWFMALWAILALGMVWSFVKLKLWKRWSLCMLHGSFLIILLGALTTWFTSVKGFVYLRQGEATQRFVLEGGQQGMSNLPFSIRLDEFRVDCYPHTDTPADYVSQLTLIYPGGKEHKATVSMNRILTQDGYRFYQSSYGDDGQSSILTVNYDPLGTGLTYVGYVLLALSMLSVLFNRREEFRRLLHHPMLQRGAMILALAFMISPAAEASRQLPAFNREKADSLSRRPVEYNGRIAPFNTMARDFLLKLYGRTTYGGLTPEQVVSGWMLRPDAWQNEPMILIKSAELRNLLHIDGRYARLTDLFHGDEYILQQYWHGADSPQMSQNPLQKAIAETDEKVGLIMMLQKGTLFQRVSQGTEPISQGRIEAELLYNRLPITNLLFMLNLTLGLLSFVLFALRQGRSEAASQRKEKRLALAFRICEWLMPVSLAVLSFAYVLRWYVAGHVPMSNGFETMQFMALAVLILACWLRRRFALMTPFGFLLSGFALLVAHLGQSNPQVTNLMPVLSSPWLSLHVSVVMMGYSLLAFTMLNGVMALIVRRQAEALMYLTRLLLYPAVFLLGAGIFLGAVWANQSWGTYWSWDPKETWALITFMIYAVAFHVQTFPVLGEPRRFHLFMVLSFATVLMTYFGVNFLLGGMHSYAG